MNDFKSFSDIDVKLVGAISHPYELAVASARTCYSGKGVILPSDVSKDDKAREIRDRIAASTLEAGHLTTRQHAHFVFSLSGVSRQFIWSFLHSHPFYNSEQVSQRHVRVQRGNFLLPPLPPRLQSLYAETVDAQMEAYEKLIRVLKEPLSLDYYQRFPARKKTPEKWGSAIDKRAYEVARYVLGIGTTAYLYHTVSALTLLRYAKLTPYFEVAEEHQIVIRKMLDCVRAWDPLFEKEIQDPLPIEKTLEFQLIEQFRNEKASESFIETFDESLEGRISKLVGHTANAESCLAEATRVALGKTKKELSDEEVLRAILDPQKNPSLAESLNVATVDKYSQVLHHVHFTFKKKLSHTADSQDQRHRTVLSSRPLLFFHYVGKPDYITPFGITQSNHAAEIYEKIMAKTFSAVKALLDEGIQPQYALYLLPNALSIRMTSTGDLHALSHKWKLRSCYNAQEEIFRATIDEVEQVKQVFPKIAEHLKAPCYVRLRASVKPYCPEGDRFCGLPVWKYDISQYQRKSL